MDQVVDILAKPEIWVAAVVSYLLGVVADAVRDRVGEVNVRKVLFPTIVANSALPPLLVACGYAGATGDFFFDVSAALSISLMFVASTAMSSTIHRGFALFAPNVAIIAIAIAAGRTKLTPEQIQDGLLAMYPLVYSLFGLVVLVTGVRPTLRTLDAFEAKQG
ncbi:hypothetical protein [Hyphomicrobium sp.]|uniref:hypothetical protein n=1 Tax=Hyphomicrobium sp. TaxID=82 RepID=UPI003F71D3AA